MRPNFHDLPQIFSAKPSDPEERLPMTGQSKSVVRKVLIVGGGVGGMSTAIALGRIGVSSEIIDINPDWGALGAGITITGPTLRALKAIGVYDEVVAKAYVGEGIQVCDTAGKPLRRLPTPMPKEAGVFGSGGIMRPTLHNILASHVTQVGATVRTGLTIDALEQDDDGVNVRFSDGTDGRYDFVVGADGLNSKVRHLIFPDAPEPQYLGQMAWRISIKRPPEIERRTYFLGGPHKVGFTPVSDDEMYMFLLERSPKLILPEEQLPSLLIKLLEDYEAPALKQIRAEIGPDTYVNYRPLEGFVLEAPWHVGRVLLVGDSAHPTTPQLASGAGIAVEDAMVLAEEFARGLPVAATMSAFTERREWRCRLVVSSSIEIGRLEQEQAPVEQQTAIVERALAKLADPV